MKDEKKVKAGKARSSSLTAERRKEIARQGALARWDADVPIAEHEGDFQLGSDDISAAVLPNGKRLITQATFLRALGRSRSPKAGTGVLSTVDGIPFFLQAEVLKPFIDNDLIMSTTPIFYKTKTAGRGVGYDAELLPSVCEVYLKFRDYLLENNKKVPTQYTHIIKACDILMRGLAHVGIIALVDEATGYQRVRDAKALQEIVAQFIRKELAVWVQRFPEEFYEEIYRLKGWPWQGMSKNRYPIVGKYTIDLVYDRLAPKVLEELEKKSPKNEKGRRTNKLHQWLSDDVGVPALSQHLYGLILLARANNTWNRFYATVERLMPKREGNLFLPFSVNDTVSEIANVP